MFFQILIALLSLFLLTIVIYYWRWFSFCRRVGIYGPFPLPYLGISWKMMRNNPGMTGLDRELQRKYRGIVPVMDFWQPHLIVYDLELLKQLQVRDFDSYTDRGTPAFLSKPLHLNLVQLDGARWKRVRSITTPTFTASKLKNFYQTFVAMVNQSLKTIVKSKEEGKPLSLLQLYGVYTAGNIAQLNFGLDVIGNDEDKKILPRLLDDPIGQIGVRNWRILGSVLFPFLMRFENAENNGDPPLMTMVAPEQSQCVVDLLDKVYKERCSGVSRNDFFQLLMNARARGPDVDNEEDAKLTHDELFSNAGFFLYAGYETTMTAMVYTTLCLALRPDLQEEVVEEIKANLGDSVDIQYDHLPSFKLLELCIKEGLRLYTPIRRFFRKTVRKTVLGGIELEKGQMITIPAHAIHRIPEYWGPDVETYNPKRFLDRPGDDVAYQAFGMGQRSCIGERLALLECKLLLSSIMLKYRIKPHRDCPLPPKVYTWSWTTKGPQELFVEFEPRQ